MKILFICTHNRCRSILAEAIGREMGLCCASAGSKPADRVHPLTLEALRRRGISTEGLYSKSWKDLAAFGPDVVITLCDQAADESCPRWMGRALKAHWGLVDPSKQAGTDEDIRAAFDRSLNLLEARLRRLRSANWKALTPDQKHWLLQQLAGFY